MGQVDSGRIVALRAANARAMRDKILNKISADPNEEHWFEIVQSCATRTTPEKMRGALALIAMDHSLPNEFRGFAHICLNPLT